MEDSKSTKDKLMVNSFGKKVTLKQEQQYVTNHASRQNSEERQRLKEEKILKIVRRKSDYQYNYLHKLTKSNELLELPKAKQALQNNHPSNLSVVNGQANVEFKSQLGSDVQDRSEHTPKNSDYLKNDDSLEHINSERSILKKIGSQESLHKKETYKFKGPDNKTARKFRAMKADVNSLRETTIEAQEYFKPWVSKVKKEKNKEKQNLLLAGQPQTTRESMIPTLSGPGFMMIPYASPPHRQTKKQSPDKFKTLESNLNSELPPHIEKKPLGTLDATKYSQGIFKTRPAQNDSALTGNSEVEPDYLTETEKKLNQMKHFQIVKQLQQRGNQPQSKTLDFKRGSQGDYEMSQYSNQGSKTGLLPILEIPNHNKGSVQHFQQLMSGLSTPERKKIAHQTASLGNSDSRESLGNTYETGEDSEGKEPVFDHKKEKFKLRNKILVNDQDDPQDIQMKQMITKKKRSKVNNTVQRNQGNTSPAFKYNDDIIPQTYSIDDLSKFSKNDIQQLLLEDLTVHRRGSDMGGKLSPSVSQVTLQDSSAQVTQFMNINQRRKIPDRRSPEAQVYSPSSSTKGLLVYPRRAIRYKAESTQRQKIDKVYQAMQSTHEETRNNSLVERKQSLKAKRTSFADSGSISATKLAASIGGSSQNVDQAFESPRQTKTHMPTLSLFSVMGSEQKQQREELSAVHLKKRRLGQINQGRNVGFTVSNLTNKYY